VIPSHIERSLFEEGEANPEVEYQFKEKPKSPMEESQILETCVNTLEKILSSYIYFCST
jgi:hypothetical protein